MRNLLLIATIAVAQAQNTPPRPATPPQPAQLPQPAAQPKAAQSARQSAEQALAQARESLERTRLAVEGSTYRFVAGVNVGPTVKNAPYSAEAVTESIQTLADGNRIVKRSTTKQYRDSEGRERREEGAPVNAIFITDPVAKTSYTLHPDTKTAQTGAAGNFTVIRSGTAPIVTTAGDVVRIVDPQRHDEPMSIRITGPGSGKIEDLGTRVIEGVSAKGTRATTVIPAGSIGNDRDIEVIDERWYSSELQLTILTRHADPRSGENTYKLINIQRSEQDKPLFEVPADYKTGREAIFYVDRGK